MATRFQGRSISLLSRPHPTTRKVEEELNRLKTWEASSKSTSGSIYAGLSGLEGLYNCLNDLLHMASTQEVLHRHRDEKCIDRLLDGSVGLLDICGLTRDIVLQIKEQVQALQFGLRRRKGDSTIQSDIVNYTCFRKKMKKNAKKFIAALKQMDNEMAVSPSPLVDRDHHLAAVIRVLREVNIMNSSVFQSVLSFLSMPVTKSKQSRWSLVSKLMHIGAIACEEKQDNEIELESVDAAALMEGFNFEKMQIAHKKLESLEVSIEELDKGLERVFRGMIKARASLLNIISQ